MGHEVRNHKLHHLHHRHRHTSNARNNPYDSPPFAMPYYAAPPPPPPPPLHHPNPAPWSYDTSSSYNNNYSLVPQPQPSTMVAMHTFEQQEQLNKALADVRRHGRNERIGEIGAAAAGAFAMYEIHEANVDPMHARKHKMEAQLAGAVALGSAGYALNEHKKKKKSEHLVEVLSGTSRHKDSSYHKNNSVLKDKSKVKWLN